MLHVQEKYTEEAHSAAAAAAAVGTALAAVGGMLHHMKYGSASRVRLPPSPNCSFQRFSSDMLALSAGELAVTCLAAAVKSASVMGRICTGCGVTCAGGLAAAPGPVAAAAPAPSWALAASPAARSASRYSRIGQYAAVMHRFFRSLPE